MLGDDAGFEQQQGDGQQRRNQKIESKRVSTALLVEPLHQTVSNDSESVGPSPAQIVKNQTVPTETTANARSTCLRHILRPAPDGRQQRQQHGSRCGRKEVDAPTAARRRRPVLAIASGYKNSEPGTRIRYAVQRR